MSKNVENSVEGQRPSKKQKLSESESEEQPSSSTSPRAEEKFTFFWKAHSPFSQFHPATFIGRPLYNATPQEHTQKGYTFLHCEQWMMYNKARLFKDEESAKKILAATAPAACKALGRKVKNFDDEFWKEHRTEIIYIGNWYKFKQNPKLLLELMKTDGTTLVEASPTDKIYGIGLSADDPRALSRRTWRGENLLGETLTLLRNRLKKDSDIDCSKTAEGEVVVASIKYVVHDTIDKKLAAQ